jgi:hypothetical protein
MKTPEGLRTGELADPTWSTASSEPVDCRSPAIRPESAAAYIADITSELAALARGSKLDILAYLLDIAQLEAAGNARRLRRETCAR